MNYFAHAHRFLDDPYFVAGTGVPDWLSVVDRKVRVRLKHAEAHFEEPDCRLASVARGVARHIRDDARFHSTRAFAEVSLHLTAEVQGVFDDDSGAGPGFLGHVLAEVLLDACLIAEQPAVLEDYYRVLKSVDPRLVEQVVNRMASGQTDRLALLISLFCSEQVLWDYLDDAKLFVRLNQVMRRVGLGEASEHLLELLPDARNQVAARKDDLLAGMFE